MVDDRKHVWVFLVERGLEAGSDVQLFWHEADALSAARRYLSRWWPVEELATAEEIAEAIEASNQVAGREEYISLTALPVVGNQYFEGDADRRPRCAACREPIELDDPDDPDSWIHCADANDLGDHTAERGRE